MLSLKSYLIFLSRNKLYTFINVFGLSLSLVFVIFIANFVVDELTTDDFHKNADQIYIIANEDWANTSYPVGGMLENRYPEIEQTCGVQKVWGISDGKLLNKTFKSPSIIAVDATFLDMFSFELLQGNRDNALASRNNMLISDQFAEKMFGDIDPLGQIIILRDSLMYSVSGVIEEMENTSFAYTDMIIRIENMHNITPPTRYDYIGVGAIWSTTLFLQVVEGVDIVSKSDDILEYFETFLSNYQGERACKEVLFIPINDFYMSDSKTMDRGLFIKGDLFITTVMLMIGVLILVFSIFNYINLTVAQTGFRAKEVSSHRLLGASKGSMFLKMILESTLLCIIAFLVGLFLAIAVEPYANHLLEAKVSIVDNFSTIWGLFYIGLIVIIAVASGLIPAIVISRFKPIDVVKGTFTFKSKMLYSKIFIVIQSIVTVFFIACSITVVLQVQHWMNIDLGYNQKGIINVPIRGYDHKDIELFSNELKSLSVVKSVGTMLGKPYEGYFTTRQSYHIDGVDNNVHIHMIECDFVAAKILGLEFLSDNQILGEGVWISETAVKMLGGKEDLRVVKNNRHGELRVKGVVKDFRIGNLAKNDGLQAFFLNVKEAKDLPASNMFIELEGDLINSYKKVEKVFDVLIKERYPNVSFGAKFFEQEIADGYEAYNRLSLVMLIFTLIAIIISALGLLGMSTYFIQQRSLEVAICKVFGSTNPQILKKMVWQFLRLLMIAFIIACPIIWYVMSEWLKEFPLSIDLSVWIFMAAGGITLLISFVTVFWQSSIAANTNPVQSIKR